MSDNFSNAIKQFIKTIELLHVNLTIININIFFLKKILKTQKLFFVFLKINNLEKKSKISQYNK